MINSINIVGNMTRDIEVRHTPSGFAVGEFGIAVNERRKDPSTGEYIDHPHFFDVKLLGKRAESLEKYLTKGTKVAVSGKLTQERWEGNGQKRSRVYIIVDELEFVSRRDSAQVEQAPEPDYGQYYQDDCPF